MPFAIKMTSEEIIEGLKKNYGTEFTAADVKGFCAMNDIAYQTVTKRLEKFKVGRGKWNLEVTVKAVENIENSFKAPSVNTEVPAKKLPRGRCIANATAIPPIPNPVKIGLIEKPK